MFIVPVGIGTILELGVGIQISKKEPEHTKNFCYWQGNQNMNSGTKIQLKVDKDSMFRTRV